MNSMRKDWKTRWRKTIFSSMGALTYVSLFYGFLFIFSFFVEETNRLSFLGYAFLLGTILFLLITYAYSCLTGKLEEENHVENENKEKDNFEDLYKRLQEETFYHTHYDRVKENTLDLLKVIKRVQKDCELTAEEHHYVYTTIPKQLEEIIDTFSQIDSYCNQEMEQKIVAFIENKKSELIQMYIKPKQIHAIQACQTAVEKAEEKTYTHEIIQE